MTVKKFILGYLENNVYVLQKDGKCIIIDPTFDSQDEIAKYIKAQNLDLQAVVLTHGHFDHCGGVSSLVEQFACPVYCHNEDWTMCSKAKQNQWKIPCENCQPTNSFVEGINHIGNFDFDVIFTPGHTRGSVCLAIGDYMFTGDTLFKDSIGRSDLEGGDSEVLLKSLVKLREITKDYKIFAGHGADTTLFREKQENYFMQIAE